MQAFMLYMSGSGVQVFSMGIVFMLLLTPFKNFAGMNDGLSVVFGFVAGSSFRQKKPLHSSHRPMLTRNPLELSSCKSSFM
jgi:hypothetical protein